MKYRKKPILTEATQWFRNGDHPLDERKRIDGPDGGTRFTEGMIVKFFRSLKIPGERFCPKCGNAMQNHGMLEGLNGEEIVCPGDYIVTKRDGTMYRMSAEEFEEQYELYEPPAHPSPRTEA